MDYLTFDFPEIPDGTRIVVTCQVTHFAKGDRVRVTAEFARRALRRIRHEGEDADEAATLLAHRGTVIKVYTQRGRVKVRWDRGEINLVLPSNVEPLSIVDRLAELDPQTGGGA